MDFILKIWSLTIEISPFLLFGFLFSGILSISLSVETVTKYLGSKKLKSIFLASFFGIPLPLCSCGVIPVFSYLKKHGASKASTTSFLISTPQTGIDSILVTYGLLGPIFAFFRPIVAFISGIVGGVLVSVFDQDNTNTDKPLSCITDCCEDKESKFWKVFDYGFIKLPQDIATPLIIGIVTAAFIFYLIPPDYFNGIGMGITGMLIMLFLGLPSYVCATASIPIALALHLKGFSMGSLIVFLMSGPATNIATISVAIKQIGKRSTIIYVLTIIICSITSGLLFDFIFPDLTVEKSLSASMHMLPRSVEVISGYVLVLILLNSIRLNYFSKSNIVENKSNTIIKIKGMSCNNCVESIKKTIKKIKGIEFLNLELKSGRLEVICSSEDLNEIKKSIVDLGFEVLE